MSETKDEPTEAPTVTVTRRGARRARGLHPWIYASDVESESARPGEVVRVLGPRQRDLGWADYSDRSQIRLRFLDHRGEWPGDEVFAQRLRDAIAYREALAIPGEAYRLVHAEADLLPATIVDRYGEYLVVQSLSQAADRREPWLVQQLGKLLGPRGIVARNDPRVREFEGLERKVSIVQGEVPDRLPVRDGDVVMEVDLVNGQKTGLFLDQRENRTAAAGYARGRLLDVFSYHGAFALQLAPRCEAVTAIEVSEDAAAAIARNAELNGRHIDVRVANAFDLLRELEAAGQRYETIVLDPPAFAKNKAALDGAYVGYKEINLRAMKLLSPGGTLTTCSCSYHVDDDAFLQVVTAAAEDVHARMTVVERRGQSRDHPVRLGMPESAYLKCLILRRLA